MKAFLCMAVAIGLAIPAAPALADEIEVTVKYDDLALSTPAGQRALDQRIHVAARKACQADTARTGTRMNSTQAQRCVEDTKRQVKRQIAAVIEQQRLGG